MQNYKLSVTKNGKKYTIVFKAETEKLARERVHKEWYSILTVDIISDNSDVWNIFLFTAKTKEWALKNWKIAWDDIFKIYVKLRRNLEYDVLWLFSEKDKEQKTEYKEKILSDLKEEFNLLYSDKKDDKLNELRKKIKEDKVEQKNLDNFYLKKELEETYKLINFVLQKLQNLLEWKAEIKLDKEQQEKIKNIYNSIIKIKKSTNVTRLKKVWEMALLKVWEIELNELEETHDKRSILLLKETNILLKRIWSKESFIEKNKDIWYIINKYFEKLNAYFISLKSEKKKETIDRKSHSYIKNILFLKRYKEKLKENNLYILKNFITLIFNQEKRVDTIIRRRVIKQNITLFKAKEKWLWFSYTSVKNWVGKFISWILNFISNIRQYLFFIVVSYTFVFIILLNLNYYFNIWKTNTEWIFYFLVILFVYLILYLTRNLILLILNFVILFFIIIFWVVNF